MARHIGLIGGIGPAATEVYYRSLVRAFAAADRKLPLTIVNADVREMIANLEAGRKDEQAAIFAAYVDQLRAGGCEVAALTSMGGHFCVAELREISSLPLISAIDAIEAYFSGAGLNKVGVLGTRRVMESGLYGIRSVEVLAPPSDELDAVHSAYTAIAMSRSATDEQRSFFHDAARRLQKEQGANAVVLGGTDLSVAFEDVELDFPIIDSAEVHAAAIAKVSLHVAAG